MEKRKVTLGKSVDGIVQILSGVSGGERVVVQGQTSLGDGSKIQDISEKNAGGSKKGRGGN